MKIKTKTISYEKAAAMPRPKHLRPHKANLFWRSLVRVLSAFELAPARVKCTGKLPTKEAYLVLMNHSCFLDLKIAAKALYPRPYGIVATHDAMMGKRWLMRRIGCMPTRKFVTDVGLIADMRYLLKRKTSVLMYPEAGYSFDGRTTVLPKKFGRLIKLLGAPVAFIETKGAFTREPLFCGLKKRKVPVTAHTRVLLSSQEVQTLSTTQIDEVIAKAFSFDGFAWQKQTETAVTEDFRAEGLERLLYRCSACETEGEMQTQGDKLICKKCGKTHRFTPLGELEATDSDTRFPRLTDWYDWQRQTVRQELLAGTYRLDVPVKIGLIFDYKAFYEVGDGRLLHDQTGFTLTGCNDKLHYTQSARSSYTLNADFFWYEKGDVIGIGDSNTLYYCFPPQEVSVTKVRLATEEQYKIIAEQGE